MLNIFLSCNILVFLWFMFSFMPEITYASSCLRTINIIYSSLDVLFPFDGIWSLSELVYRHKDMIYFSCSEVMKSDGLSYREKMNGAGLT